ncbi:MAG: DsbA family protein [Pseudomonadota bacterium]
MKIDWGQVVLTIGIATATALAAVGATVGLRPAGADVRRYLLAHPEVIPEAMAALEKRESGKAVGANRAAIETPVGDAWIGNPKGDVTVVEFFDYNCTYCRASLPILAQLVKSDPNVRVVFRELPVLSQASFDAAKLSYAAALQGRFRAFHDPLYRAGQVTPATLNATAAAAGVDRAQAAKVDRAAEAEIKRNIGLARQLRMSGTPSWVIGDRVIVGMVQLSALQDAVKDARAR